VVIRDDARKNHSEYRVMLGGALEIGVTPVEIKEIVYPAVPYVGMARVTEHARDLVLSGDDVADLERPHSRSLDPTRVPHVADGRRAVQSAQRGVSPGENVTPFGMRDVASRASDMCFAPRDVWLAQRGVWPAQRGVCSGLCVV
jgi:hypothetical protein